MILCLHVHVPLCASFTCRLLPIHHTDAVLHRIPQLRVMRKAHCSHSGKINVVNLLNPLVVESEGVRPVDAEPQTVSIQ